MDTNTSGRTLGDRNVGTQSPTRPWNVPANIHPNIVSTSKYTLFTFFPLNMAYQLSKGPTFFFFVTLILISIPSISPFEPWTYLIAFGIVVGVSMIKDAMEDYKRHQDDGVINNTMVRVLERAGDSASKFVVKEKACMDLQKGDWLLAERDKELQADVVLMRSKLYHKDELVCSNHCFVETGNIDGESNLKKRNAIATPSKYPCTRSHRSGSHSELNSLEHRDSGICSCAEYFVENLRSFELKDTGDSYNDFECDINFKGHLLIANEKNALLRGSILKNTENCLCLVVGIGEETKQAKGLYKSKKGKTLFDARMNSILAIVLLLYALVMIATLMLGAMFLSSHSEEEYLGISSIGGSLVKLSFSNYILYIYLIPLSLYVMLEIIRVVHVFYVKFDPQMQIDGTKSMCRNSNAVADLGFVDYILSDKTGTITKNLMTLKYLHLYNGASLVDPKELCEDIANSLNSSTQRKELSGSTATSAVERVLRSDQGEDTKKKLLFLINMLVCSSVEILNNRTEGISQEELCFLEAIRPYGFELKERDDNYVVVRIGREVIRMDIVGVLEFTSRRQRMSIIYEIFGKYYLFTKGSDQKLLDKTRDARVLAIINSSTDYRSLVLKFKEVCPEDISEFRKATVLRINEVDEGATDDEINEGIAHQGNLVGEQKQREEESFKVLEANTTYLGSVFVEDELQDEVQETMRVFKEAGIKIWMITGDKKETAISCAKNSMLINGNNYWSLSGKQALELIERLSENESVARRSTSLSRIIPNCLSRNEGPAAQPQDGSRQGDTASLGNNPRSLGRYHRGGLPFHSNQENQADAGENIFGCESVVVYRATPSQKGKIASLLVKSKRNVLSIGDGNNDVAMLKDSHVGVGIIGKEGTQAALSADFAIPQFKLLRNLIFIHGRYSLIRYTKIALNSYYKNIVFVFIQFIYNLYSGASGRPLYNSFILNYYNLLFTSLIPFSIALFDKDVPPNQVMNQPSSHKTARRYFEDIFIYSNVALALAESVIIFFMIKILLLNDISGGSGILGGYTCTSTIFSIVVVYTVVLRQIKMISFRVIYNDVSIALSIILNLVAIFCVQEIYNKSNLTIYHLLGMPAFYFTLLSLGSLIFVVDSLYDNIDIYLFERMTSKN